MESYLNNFRFLPNMTEAFFDIQTSPRIRIYMNQRLKNHKTYTKALGQLAVAADLSGVIEPVIGMPDLTPAYGLPVGGILVTDAKNGDISLNAIGGDINCGISLSQTNIPIENLLDNQLIMHPEKGKELSKLLNEIVAGDENVNAKQILVSGASAITPLDELQKIESYGIQEVSNKKLINEEMIEIVKNQLGTLGGGNHFIDLMRCEEIYDEDLSTLWELDQKTVQLMLHTGSRGLGNYMRNNFVKENDSNSLAISRLKPVIFNSQEGKDILDAVNIASNFGYANRVSLRNKILEKLTLFQGNQVDANLIYDFGHNNITVEDYENKKIVLHRKGSSRGLPRNHQNNTEFYKETRHPIIIPGSLGTATYVLVGTEKLQETFYSINHGSGRKYTRGYVRKKSHHPRFNERIEDPYINLRFKDYCEETPNAYKDIEEVIDTLEQNGFVKKVAKLKPCYVYIEKDKF